MATKTLTNKLILRTKCVLLGNPAVGKSAITQLFHSDGSQFSKNYSMTIHAEVYIKPVNIPDSSVTVELFIYDLGCHEIFQDYIPKYLEDASLFAFVYDVTNNDSFKNLTKWVQLVRKVTGKKVIPGVLIGNKIDLSLRRSVSVQHAEEFAKSYGFEYFETSALSNADIEDPFHFLANMCHANYEEQLKEFIKDSQTLI
ncbi:P-loop containing nucleoside triphosphate hydrolase protein [Neocallimastix lanati (nom. inval.)]|uniref:p-loop containing nucleoside triphosphate hydrolase protein n=1 Tax=Neocallimastix californiae TaxID=1754190 RepID=A0A1Y2DYN6_9FUNG|nr:P-loop containing nucleoside triphosphate hydrolase protein [Neocallimastix sp. JGI-2020a]ORY63755.1 P-loop containing nucleoside triphosphate hydrolase protein [Neocallimastix californiae]|eukprot:ORY63755.1 P-loop containing nucleoside triphosphate hydrolase protein [Neocallimastix californiae]